MPRISKQARHLKRAREIQAQKSEKKNDKRRKINEVINKIDESKLDNTLELITKLPELRNEQFSLISSIQKLSEEELPAANHLIRTMRYPKGLNEGKLISPYLQNKAQEYVSQNLCKNKISVTSLQETNNKMVSKIKQLQRQNEHLIRRTQSLGAYAGHLRNQKSRHISEIRSLVRQSQKISDNAFKSKIKSIFKTNEREYTSKTVWLATSISQIGQLSMRSTVECTRIIYEFLIGEPPRNWLSTSTLHTWHQDVSQLYITNQISQIANTLAFGVMVDKSTRGEIKNLVICYQVWNEQKQAPLVITTNLLNIQKCNSETVSNAVIKSIQEAGLDVMKCILWTTDNTAYMSLDKKGAVLFLIKKLM